MKLTKLETKSNSIIDVLDFSWEELKSLFSSPLTDYTEKMKVPLFSPCEFKAGTARSNASALRVHFGVVDLDDITRDTFVHIANKMKPYDHMFYTSWSHTAVNENLDKFRLRLVFPLDRPVEASEWSEFWSKLYLFLDKNIDPKCKDIQRGYFYPASTNSNSFWILDNVGLTFSVDSLLSKPIKELKSTRIEWSDLLTMANKFKNSKSEFLKKQARNLELANKGQAFADHGDRDNSLFEIAQVIVSEFPTFDSVQVADLFNKSLSIMRSEGSQKATTENFINKLTRAKSKIIEEKEAARKQEFSEMSENIKRAFRSDRIEPYSQEELNRFADRANSSLQELNKQWILYNNKNNYVLVDGSYRGPIANVDMLPSIHIELAPAISAGVFTKKEVKEKKISKSLQELYEEYGSYIEAFVCDMRANQTYYVKETATLVEATCPVRVKSSNYHPEIDQYLRLLGGTQYEKLKDFISAITQLDDPCAALYLYGAKGVGKSLLMQGLSRLWTEGGPTEMAGVLSDGWNSSLSRCPLVIADESMPESFRKDGKTGAFRRFLQERTRELKRRYRENATLKGCVRVIIAANNMDLLDTNENLDEHDIEAITERVLFVDCQPEASDYLNHISDIQTWVTEDKIAEHALWLRDNHQIKERSRFLVSGSASHFHQQMMVKNGLASAILNWLVSYLQEPNLIDNQQTGFIRVKDGELLVNQKILLERWDTYVTNIKPPTVSALTKALKRISNGTKIIKWNKTIRYTVIKTESLIQWAEISDIATREEINEALSKDTDKKEGLNRLKKALEIH